MVQKAGVIPSLYLSKGLGDRLRGAGASLVDSLAQGVAEGGGGALGLSLGDGLGDCAGGVASGCGGQGRRRGE